MRSGEYKAGYAAGYNTSARNWPKHCPPEPPNIVIAKLMNAAKGLRDGFDNLIAQFGECDPIEEELGPLVDALDDAMVSVSEWLRGRE